MPSSSVVRVNSRFVDKFFFFLPLFYPLFFLGAHAPWRRKQKKPNASCRFHGRFDEVRQADFFSLFVSISHTLTKRHTQQDSRVFRKTHGTTFECHCPVLCLLSSRVVFLLFFLKLEKSTHRDERKKGKTIRT